MQLGSLNELVMENLVSKSRLLWQQLHTTPPPVVLSLYLQNAQLSPKPALCWEETAVSLSLFSVSHTRSLSFIEDNHQTHLRSPSVMPGMSGGRT